MNHNTFIFTHKGVDKDKCQDICQYKDLSCGTVIALADGVSSQENSAMGANRVQEDIAWMLEEEGDLRGLDDDGLRIKIARTIYESINQLSRRKRCSEHTFASTLMMVIFPDDADFYWTVHIGDGIIGIVNEMGEVEVLSAPQNGITRQYTYTTVSNNLLKRIRIKKCDKRGRVFMMTDGITNEIFRDEETRKEYVKLIENLDWEAMEKKLLKDGAEDDIGFCCTNF